MLRVLLLLQARERMTAQELAERVNSSPRTIQRDLQALSLAGVPIYPIRGRYGGWALLPDYRTRLTGLTPTEAMTVFVGATAHVLADLGLDTAADQAATKLLAALPASMRRDVEYARQRLLVDPLGWDQDDRGTLDPNIAVCREGLWQERMLEIQYGTPPSRRVVAPLGLVAKGRAWYLVARRDQRIRTYRVGRIESAAVLDQTFTRPMEFDLAEHWTDACRQLRRSRPSYPIRIRVRDRSLRRFTTNSSATMGPSRRGWCPVDVDLENPHEAAAVVLSLGGDAVVLEPAELRKAVRQLATKLVTAHASSS
jgi:predicted DNA-binding transcriptional regulator YafY